jgi:hypothetical protein
MARDFDPAPRATGVKENEEIDGAVAAILVIEAQRVHTARLRSVQRGSVCSSGSPRESRRPDESGYGSIVWRVSPTTPLFTDKQGQYLAFIYAYSRIFRQPPAEADMQRHFQVSPPSVHQMVLTLERAGLIRRTAGVARSIELLVKPEDLPVLR